MISLPVTVMKFIEHVKTHCGMNWIWPDEKLKKKKKIRPTNKPTKTNINRRVFSSDYE